MVNGLYGLSGEAAKEARRIKYGIPQGTPAGKDYVTNTWLPGQKASAPASPVSSPASGAQSGETSNVFGFDLPNKIAGMPTWMMLAGAGIVVMFMFKGSSKKR